MKILYVYNFAYADYQSDSIYHGLIDSGVEVYETSYPAYMLQGYEHPQYLHGKGFTIHGDIFVAMQQPDIKEKLIKTVSAERIREEIFKMMKHDTPKTLRLIHHVDEDFIPGFTSMIFDRGLWLKPTFEL